MILALAGDTTIGEAIANTCMGMGIVFLVLIFIMLIISLFSFIPKIQDAFANRGKKTQVDEAPVPAAAPVKAPASENLINDAELVAVITAAIYAASGSAASAAPCNDQLIVRSIRRAR